MDKPYRHDLLVKKWSCSQMELSLGLVNFFLLYYEKIVISRLQIQCDGGSGGNLNHLSWFLRYFNHKFSISEVIWQLLMVWRTLVCIIYYPTWTWPSVLMYCVKASHCVHVWYIYYPPQLSNLWWMPNSVSKGFDTTMRMGSSRQVKRYPTAYRWVSSQLPFTED